MTIQERFEGTKMDEMEKIQVNRLTSVVPYDLTQQMAEKSQKKS